MPRSTLELSKVQARRVSKKPSVVDRDSPKNSDSTEDSDSDVKMEILNTSKRTDKKSNGGNLSQEIAKDETASDSYCSELELTPTCDFDFSDQDPQKLQEKRGTPQYQNTFDDSSESDKDSDAESRKEILRSAEKRIIRNISTSESDSRNMKVHEKYESSSDSDSAPENVTFEVGRKTAMEVLKQSVDSIRREKLRKKEQSKKKLENIKRQKEKKLIRLKEQKRSIENASCSSSTESTLKPSKKQSTVTSEQHNVTLGKKIYFSSDLEMETKSKHVKGRSISFKLNRSLKRLPATILDNLPDQIANKQQKQVVGIQNSNQVDLQSMKKETRNLHSQMQWDTDYIPLDSGGVTQFGVVPLDKTRKKTVAEEAAAFRQNMLYGNKIKRTQGNMNAIRQQKLKVCGMDRLVTRR